MMRLPLPLRQRFQDVLWGMALGGSWGWIHNCPRVPENDENNQPGSCHANPLIDVQQFIAALNCEDQQPPFEYCNAVVLEFVQLIQFCVQTQCERNRLIQVPSRSVENSNPMPVNDITPDRANWQEMRVDRIRPWINTLIATLLNLPAASRLEMRSQTQASSSESNPAAQNPVSETVQAPTILDLTAISLLWKTMLLRSSIDWQDSLAFTALLTDWQQMFANLDKTALDQTSQDNTNQDTTMEWVSLLLPLEAEYRRQRPLSFVARQILRQGLTTQSTAIAIAWYAFRTSPHDPLLSLTRAVQRSPDPTLSGLLTGVWSNLYNGEVFDTSTSGQVKITSLPVEMQKSTFLGQSLSQSATQLFATWAGILCPATVLDEASLLQMTAPRRLHHL